MKKFKKIYVEITNTCNKNCSFCLGSENKKIEMNLIHFERVLQQIKPYTNYIYLHIKGEPLIHKDFNGILELCSKYNIIVNITTNGSLLPKQVDIISKTNVIRQVNISLQSIEDEKDISQFENILEAVDLLLKKTNILFVYRLWALKDNKLTDVNKKLVQRIIEYYELDYLKDEIFSKSNIELNKNLYLNKAAIFEWPSLDNDYVDDEGFCYGLKSHLGILSDGTVIPCCLDSKGVINLGNIFNEEFEDILNKTRTKEIIDGFKRGVVVEELCKKCSYRKRFKKQQNVV